MGEIAMSKSKNKSSTRRKFVKEVAAGSVTVAVAGAMTASGSPQAATSSGTVEERLKAVEQRLQHVEDVQAINRLQYAYNYYVEHMMKQEIIDCFADSPDVLLDWLEGKWKGKEGVKEYFNVNQVPSIGFRHQLMPSSGLITVEADGRRAKGRWYAFGGIMMPAAPQDGKETSFSRSFISGIYEIGYIKEEGIWKILTINWIIPYGVRIDEGWIMPEDIAGPMLKGQGGPEGAPMTPDIPMDPKDLRYVTGYIFPFHFKHPVTGKPTSEARLNARLAPLKP
jgi:hypothetical protein